MSWFSDLFSGFQRWGKDIFMPLRFWSAAPAFNEYALDAEKIRVIFKNPAMLKVLSLQCDLFSLAEVYVYQDGKIIENDPALDRINNPNPRQTRKQFLWDYMMWNMIGNVNLYVDSDIVTNTKNKLYFLENGKIEWPESLRIASDKIILSDAAEKALQETILVYRYFDGTSFSFTLKRLSIITDLSNGIGNWFKGFSRIDALYKIISNSEAALDAENINIRYSGKFLVAGTQDPNDVSKIPLSDPEKMDIETKMNGNKQVHAVKSMIEIKRFVEDMKKLQLDEKYLAAYFLIGNMYNIPRDVLEAYASSTFENQEKATGKHISYTLEPKAADLASSLAKRFGYDAIGKTIVFSWDHLPFNQVFEKDRAETDLLKAEAFISLRQSGVSLEDANKFLDTNFTEGGELGTAKPVAASSTGAEAA